MFEQSFKRPKNYFELTSSEQWDIDKRLGILDWCAEDLSEADRKRFRDHYSTLDSNIEIPTYVFTKSDIHKFFNVEWNGFGSRSTIMIVDVLPNGVDDTTRVDVYNFSFRRMFTTDNDYTNVIPLNIEIPLNEVIIVA